MDFILLNLCSYGRGVPLLLRTGGFPGWGLAQHPAQRREAKGSLWLQHPGRDRPYWLPGILHAVLVSFPLWLVFPSSLPHSSHQLSSPSLSLPFRELFQSPLVVGKLTKFL
jgi:hypothetical protein